MTDPISDELKRIYGLKRYPTPEEVEALPILQEQLLEAFTAYAKAHLQAFHTDTGEGKWSIPSTIELIEKITTELNSGRGTERAIAYMMSIHRYQRD